MKRIALAMLCAAVAVLLFWRPAPQVELTDAGPAPEISAAQWINAVQPPSLQALRGKVVVLEFWATWCPPCVQSLGRLAKLRERWPSGDVVIVAMTDEPPGPVSDFLRKNHVPFAVGAGSLAGATYGVHSIPQSVVVDRSGHIVWRGHPEAGLEQAITRAARQGSFE